MTLGECDKEFCVGPLTRHEVEELFKGSPLGPRCIPAFGIWQKGKLRRVDDACRSKHNAITRMWETIACCGADLPARIAAEFAKHISVDKLFLRLGTACNLGCRADHVDHPFKRVQRLQILPRCLQRFPCGSLGGEPLDRERGAASPRGTEGPPLRSWQPRPGPERPYGMKLRALCWLGRPAFGSGPR